MNTPDDNMSGLDSIVTIYEQVERTSRLQSTPAPAQNKEPDLDVISKLQSMVVARLQKLGIFQGVQLKIRISQLHRLEKKLEQEIELAEKTYPSWFLRRSAGELIDAFRSSRAHRESELIMLTNIPSLYPTHAKRYLINIEIIKDLGRKYQEVVRYLRDTESELERVRINLKIRITEFESQQLEMGISDTTSLLLPPEKNSDGSPNYDLMKAQMRRMTDVLGRLTRLSDVWDQRVEFFHEKQRKYHTVVKKYQATLELYYPIFKRVPYELRRIELLFKAGADQYLQGSEKKDPAKVELGLTNMGAVIDLVEVELGKLNEKLDWHARTSKELDLLSNSLAIREGQLFLDSLPDEGAMTTSSTTNTGAWEETSLIDKDSGLTNGESLPKNSFSSTRQGEYNPSVYDYSDPTANSRIMLQKTRELLEATVEAFTMGDFLQVDGNIRRIQKGLEILDFAVSPRRSKKSF